MIRLLLTLCLLWGCSVASAQTWEALATDANLVARWIGNNNANSETGTGHGTWNGSAAYSDDRPAGHNYGRSFDLTASSTWIDVGDLELTGNTVTFTCWTKASGAQTNYAGLLYSRGSTTAGIHHRSTSGQYAYTWAGSYYNVTTGHEITGDWQFVAMTIAPGVGRLIVNGTVFTNTASHGSIAYASALAIGRDSAQTSNGDWIGLVYDPRIYNRTLSPTEIATIYAGPNTANVPAAMINYARRRR